MTLEQKWEWDAWHFAHDRDWRESYRFHRRLIRRRAVSPVLFEAFRRGFRNGLADAGVANVKPTRRTV